MPKRKRVLLSAGILVIGLISSLGIWAPNGFFPFSYLVNSEYIDEIRNSGKLIVLTRNAPTTYYEGRDGPEGLEYDLINDFARGLSLEVTFIVKENVSEILQALQAGEAHIAAAGLSNTVIRERNFLFSPAYQEVSLQVVCRRERFLPQNIDDLKGINLWVPSGTSYSEKLHSLKSSYPFLQWKETGSKNTEQLLEMVWKSEIDCTIADSNIVEINRRYFPELMVAFNISEESGLVWLLPVKAYGLQQVVGQWLEQMSLDGTLEEYLDRYYGHIDLFDYVDTRRFSKRIKSRLPKYRQYFEEAADSYNLSWTMLAAQSYQESHWRPRAMSPTGVRGMMMLTLPTAKEMGIKSRLNAQQSIMGGAKYLAQLRQRLPENIVEPDRTWFALAAYNVGLGHIYDARTLATDLGKNPDKWSEMATVLPLLSQEKYHRKLKHGYARGSEPVNYVNRIRDYTDLLENSFNTTAGL